MDTGALYAALNALDMVQVKRTPNGSFDGLREGSETLPVVTATINDLTGVIKFSRSGAEAARSSIGMRIKKSFCVKPMSGYSSAAGPMTQTTTMAMALPAGFEAIRIGYVHLGGNGATVATTACCAATDDFGPMDYALGAANTSLRKFCTPWRDGTEYNTLSQNGWKALTFAGAASVDIADPGADKISVTWSDKVQCHGLRLSNGKYGLIVRLHHGTGAYTGCGYTGIATGTNYLDDSSGHYLALASRTGVSTTDPTQWTQANTPNYPPTQLPPIIIEAFSADGARSILMVGDSRIESTSELSATKAYLGLPALLNQQLAAQGKNTTVMRAGKSGTTTAQYYNVGSGIVNAVDASAVDTAIYLIWSVNDGAASDANIELAKYRALMFVDACVQKGIRPILLTSFPKGNFAAGDFARLTALDSWASGFDVDVVSPLVLLGDPTTGAYRPGYGYDNDHGTQAAYSMLASTLAAII